MVEQPIRNRQVVGSTPTLGSNELRVGNLFYSLLLSSVHLITIR